MMSMDSGDQTLIQAEQIKNEANKLFQSGKYSEAYQKYSAAIELNPNSPTYYGNRSFASLKLENYGDAINDAEMALKLDPSFIKAYYRRASANMALSHYKEALRDFRMVCKYAPNDTDARQKLTTVEKLVKRIEFERAMAYDDINEKSVLEKINYVDMVVEDSYDGVKWEEDRFSKEFVFDMISRFEKEKRIHKKYAFKLLAQVYELLKSLPTIVDINLSNPSEMITVCGDVHGQFYDLLNIFRRNGFPNDAVENSHSYLFNGDFVDRGSFSVEVIFTLLGFKLLYPQNMFLSRGNHETDDMNRVYGFQNEVKVKYQSEMMFKLFSEIFNACPLGNLIQSKALVIHGGLFSNDNVTIDDLRQINRFRQPPSSIEKPTGSDLLMTELLWSDPGPDNGRIPSKRGVAIQFGPDVTAAFCKLNNLDKIIRSHEVKDNGYSIDHNGQCVTVFSAPNYCDQIGNKGAYINISLDEKDNTKLVYVYETFEAVPHPKVKPMQYAEFGGMMGF